ncbi:electron transfer flavoprotein subunit alpha/FixB family protein [Derxia gummosa]|uniref:Electron transfer flavoprotein subunit alpha n=1 Tax=Derxia gummosa DSM 723 TaxID=1121388 RepID=A0A8B6X2H1_9BURK|nr:electron transfer flavoprotein subunit alpha/FixB family protein [Derxia gummosa]
MKTLVLAAHDGKNLDDATARLVTAARQLGAPIDVLVIGSGIAAVAGQAAALDGVSRVRAVDADACATVLAEDLAAQLVAIGAEYRVVVARHDMLARAALPRAAVLADAGFLADVTAIPAADRFIRPMYAGGVVAEVAPVQDRLFITVRPSAFAPAGTTDAAVTVEPLAATVAPKRAKLVGREVAGGDRPDLTRARIVAAGGRGVGSAEHMKLVEAVADRVNGAVGASRAAVDAGFAPNAIQVGQTGKTVAPDVYLAFGISGAIQHVAGIKDARVIVAVNKDPDAPIFQIADIGLVGDIFEVLPRLASELPSIAA